MSSILEFKREEVVDKFIELGYRHADDWPNEKLETFLNDIDIAVEDDQDFEDKELESFIVEVKFAIRNGSKIKIIEDEKTEEEIEEQELLNDLPTLFEETREKVEQEPPEIRSYYRPSKPLSEGRTVVATSKLDPKRIGPEVEGDLKGIKSLKNRLFFAGVLIKRHGLGPGLTDEILEEVNSLCRNSNKKATKSQTRMAWHAINGFLNGEDVVDVQATLKEDQDEDQSGEAS
jgi:hypothetical protein